MLLRYVLLLFCFSLLSCKGYGENECNSCEIDYCYDVCNTCETDCFRFFPPILVVPWSSYSYFCINDDRSNGLGVARGQSVLLGFSYYFSKHLWLTPYGSYESSKNSGPVLNRFIDSDNFPQQSVTRVEGGGGGAQLDYLFCCYWTAYFNFGYVHVTQHLTTKDLANITGDVLSDNSGHRWQLLGGLNFTYTFPCIAFSGDLSYLYISSHLNESVDNFRQKLTDQNATLGTGRAKASLFFFPCATLTPFICGGIEEDLNRHNDLPIFFPLVGPPAEVSFSPRDRFEWNTGAGILLKKDRLTFSFIYQYKRRPGPIKTDILTAYASMIF